MPTLGLFAQFGETLVQAVLPEQLCVRAALGNASVVYHQDLIGVLRSCQSVSNGDDGLAPRQFRKRLLDEVLVFRVNAGGCLVKNDDRRILQNRPGDRYALFLAARERPSASPTTVS